MKKGKVIWLTGLPCSGKTTIANELKKYLKESFLAYYRIHRTCLAKKLSVLFNQTGPFFKKKLRENIF